MTSRRGALALSVIISVFRGAGAQEATYTLDETTKQQNGGAGNGGSLGTTVGVAVGISILCVLLMVYLPAFIYFMCRRSKIRKRRERGDSSSTVPLRSQVSMISNGSSRCPDGYNPVPTRDRANFTDPNSRRRHDFVSRWCTEHKLTEDTAKILRSSGYQQKEELEALAVEDIPRLGLTMAQESLLKKIVMTRQQKENEMAVTVSSRPPSHNSSVGSAGFNQSNSSGHISSPPATTARSSHGSTSMSPQSQTDEVEGRLSSINSNTSRFRYPSIPDSVHPNTPPGAPSRQTSVTKDATISPFSGGPSYGGDPSSTHIIRQTSRQSTRTLPGSPGQRPASVGLPMMAEPEPRFHGKLSDSGLWDLAAKIGHEYEQLATFLQIPRKLLEQIKMDYNHRAHDRIYQILRLYRDTARGEKAEIKGRLHKALEKCGRKDLAEELLQETVTGSVEKLASTSVV